MRAPCFTTSLSVFSVQELSIIQHLQAQTIWSLLHSGVNDNRVERQPRLAARDSVVRHILYRDRLRFDGEDVGRCTLENGDGVSTGQYIECLSIKRLQRESTHPSASELCASPNPMLLSPKNTSNLPRSAFLPARSVKVDWDHSVKLYAADKSLL